MWFIASCVTGAEECPVGTLALSPIKESAKYPFQDKNWLSYDVHVIENFMIGKNI